MTSFDPSLDFPEYCNTKRTKLLYPFRCQSLVYLRHRLIPNPDEEFDHLSNEILKECEELTLVYPEGHRITKSLKIKNERIRIVPYGIRDKNSTGIEEEKDEWKLKEIKDLFLNFIHIFAYKRNWLMVSFLNKFKLRNRINLFPSILRLIWMAPSGHFSRVFSLKKLANIYETMNRFSSDSGN